MATEPRPIYFHPPSVEFLLRRSLTIGPLTAAPDICVECGQPVAAHRVPGTMRFLGCAEVLRRADREQGDQR